jgi:GMP synthase-like glutamine amidotransferase
MRVLIIENYSQCPIDYLEQVFADLGVELTILNVLEADKEIPQDALTRFDGLLVLGGAMGAYDDEDYPNIPKIVQALCDFHEAEKGIFAICLGAQMLARALGESFKSNEGLELGFVPLTVTEEGQKDALFEGVSKAWSPIEWHEDNFHIPAAATLMMSGEACKNQAFKAGRASYAFQFHPEISGPGICTMVAGLDAPYLEEVGEEGRILFDKMIADVPEFIGESNRAAKRLIENWVKML